jgi:hypothetical protein
MPMRRLLLHVPFMNVHLFSFFSLVLAKGECVVGIVGC